MGESDKGGRREFSRAANLAIELGASIVVCALIGYYLDRIFGTAPWAIFGGIVLGTAAGFWNAYKIALGPQKGRPRTKE